MNLFEAALIAVPLGGAAVGARVGRSLGPASGVLGLAAGALLGGLLAPLLALACLLLVHLASGGPRGRWAELRQLRRRRGAGRRPS